MRCALNVKIILFIYEQAIGPKDVTTEFVEVKYIHHNTL